MDRMRIAHIGFLSYIKGMKIFNRLIHDHDITVDWYIIGGMEPNNMDWSTATITDHYKSFNELHDYIDYFDIDCIIMLSICPESFSYTLTEAWMMGIPVIGSSMGAIGHRINETGCGKVVNPFIYHDVKNVLMNITYDDLYTISDRIQTMDLPSYDTMINKYNELYNNMRI